MSWEKKQLETYGCLGADVSFNKNNFGCIATCRYYHISFDGGETFITKYLDPDEDEFIIGIDDVQVLDDDTILLAVYKAEGFQIINAYLYISHDYGETWIKRETNTKRPTILCFLNSQEGWIAGRYKAQSHTWANYIIHTTDGGQTWEEQLDTITSAKKGLGSIKFVNDSVGYATEYWYQTWRTTNGGKNWDIIIDSQSGEIEDFFIDMACLPDGSIIAPTYTGYKYIYKYIPSGTPVNDPAATTGLNIFPNPATETARVEFTLEGFGNVRMELSDALGRRVLAIDDMYYPAGRSSAELDVSGFAPGVYYLRISTHAGAETIPLIIAR
ncbi:MAG: T9SS type A sorting domain-containing protein [Candidatus Kapaibacterium sp.]